MIDYFVFYSGRLIAEELGKIGGKPSFFNDINLVDSDDDAVADRPCPRFCSQLAGLSRCFNVRAPRCQRGKEH
jgi:hypothetical protein